MDGVLNSTLFIQQVIEKDYGGNNKAFNQEIFNNHKENSPDFWRSMIDPQAVERLNRIVEQTGANVVISSMWRRKNSVDDMRAHLQSKGFAGKIIGETPKFGMHDDGNRQAQIDRWIRENEKGLNIKGMAILDDMSVNNFIEFMDVFVYVDGHEGLLEKHVEQAVAALKIPYLGKQSNKKEKEKLKKEYRAKLKYWRNELKKRAPSHACASLQKEPSFVQAIRFIDLYEAKLRKLEYFDG